MKKSMLGVSGGGAAARLVALWTDGSTLVPL